MPAASFRACRRSLTTTPTAAVPQNGFSIFSRQRKTSSVLAGQHYGFRCRISSTSRRQSPYHFKSLASDSAGRKAGLPHGHGKIFTCRLYDTAMLAMFRRLCRASAGPAVILVSLDSCGCRSPLRSRIRVSAHAKLAAIAVPAHCLHLLPGRGSHGDATPLLPHSGRRRPKRARPSRGHFRMIFAAAAAIGRSPRHK